MASSRDHVAATPSSLSHRESTRLVTAPVTVHKRAGAAAARFGVKVGERVWRVNGRAVGEALDFNGVVGLCRQRPVALDLVDAEA